ncbi:cysteine-rich receptor-like protein kinase 40 isoform X1 [Miscanthus floridulus]|uniref:cysteine-rich receptor-like protein kinase 40 isoform X1 n=1 Tax=Miscanthus floridulus TaxID=154761 RepID=UPI00345A1070
MASLQSQQSLASTLPTNLPVTFMKEITRDFSVELELGRSVFGTVYKGVLPEGGRMIAVKRLAENAPVPSGVTFETEVTNLMALKHDNIVELVHYCHESQKKVVQHNGRYVIVDVIESCLCYRYLPKGSLDNYLYAATTSINWDTRFKIVKGICQGLHFLHKELVGGPLIHMNLVPNSIWLDDNWVPKIADFGLSRLFGKEQTRMYTVNVKGHNGYIAPEYLYRGEISTMSDIYSLGMIILEITTRERNSSASEDRSARQFVDNIHQNWKTDEQIMYKHPLLDPNGLQQVKACIIIGLKCVEADRNKRPSIADIVDKLNGKRVPIFDQVSPSQHA